MLKIEQNDLDFSLEKNIKLNNNYFDTLNKNKLKINHYSKDKKLLDKSALAIKNKNILTLVYYNENKEKCMKFSEIFDMTLDFDETNILEISKVSQKELISKRIIKKDEDEIKNHIFNLIEKMERDDSFKTIIKQQFTNSNKFFLISDSLPILYFDEILNKKVWVVPNNTNSNDDLIFDYETEIPFFQQSFNSFYDITKRNKKSFIKKSFIIFKKDEMVSVNLSEDSNIFYSMKNPNSFVFSDICDNKDDLLFRTENINIKDYITQDINILMPQLYNLNIERSIKILKLLKSEKKIEEIKRNINLFLNPDGYEKKLEVMEQYINGVSTKSVDFELNNIFVSNKINFFDIDDQIINNHNEEIFLSNLNIYLNRFEERLEINLNINKVNIDEQYLDNLDIENTKPIILLKNKEKLFLPKESCNKGIYFDDILNKINNYFNKDRNSEYFFYEDNFICIKNNENINLIELDKDFIFDEEINSDKINLCNNKNYVLLHHKNKDLYLINLLTKEYTIIDNTENFVLLSDKISDNIKLTFSLQETNIVLTENKSFNFINDKNNNFNYTEKNKKEGNYILNFDLPLEKVRNENVYKFKSNAKFENDIDVIVFDDQKKSVREFKNFNIEYKISDKFYTDNKDIEYFNKDVNVLSNCFYFENYLNELTINNISLNKKESLIFIKKVFKNKNKNFIISKENGSDMIKVDDLNKKEDTFIVLKNKKTKFNLSLFLNNNTKKSDIIDLYNKNEIIFYRENKKLNKLIYSSKDKLFLLNDGFSDFVEQFFSFEQTKLLEKNVLNNDILLNYNYENKEFEFIFEKSGKFLRINNKNLINNLNKKINSFEISF